LSSIGKQIGVAVPPGAGSQSVAGLVHAMFVQKPSVSFTTMHTLFGAAQSSGTRHSPYMPVACGPPPSVPLPASGGSACAPVLAGPDVSASAGSTSDPVLDAASPSLDDAPVPDSSSSSSAADADADA